MSRAGGNRRAVGGLDYPIVVRDQFSSGLARFRRGIVESRKEVQAFKRELSRPVRGGNQAGSTERTVRAVRQETERQTRAVREQRKEAERRFRTEGDIERAIAAQNKQARSLEQASARATRAKRTQFRLERRILPINEQRRQAEVAVSREINKQAVASRARDAAVRRRNELSRESARRLGIETARERRLRKAQEDRRKVVQRLRNAQATANNQNLRELRAQTIATERLNQAEIRRRSNEILRAAGRADLATESRTRRRQKETLTRWQQLTRALDKSGQSANRVSFTFRRLIGILALFAIAREAVAGINALVASLVRTSAAIESAEIGLAGLIVSSASVRDLNGIVTDSAEALALAQIEAREQLRLLRIESINTTASFDELAQAFQVALAPGLAAGLELEEIRKFTVLISQAATAIGLEQRQLAEEVRSILGGTIRVTQTRIAAALNLTNEDIRRAREAGRLFEFLREELIGFEEGGRAAARTFEGLVRRIRDAVNLTLVQGGVEFFEQLKDSLEGVIGALVQVQGEGENREFVFNEDLVKAVENLSDGLTEATINLEKFLRQITAEQLQDFAEVLGGVFSALGTIVGASVTGIVQSVSLLKSVFEDIASVVEGITGIDLLDPSIYGPIIREIVKWGGAIVLVTALFGGLLAVVGGAFGIFAKTASSVGKLTTRVLKLLSTLKLVPAGLKASTVFMSLLSAKFLLLAGAVAAAGLGIANFYKVTDFDLSKAKGVQKLARDVDFAVIAFKNLRKEITRPGPIDPLGRSLRFSFESISDIKQRQKIYEQQVEDSKSLAKIIVDEFKEIPKEIVESLGATTDEVAEELDRLRKDTSVEQTAEFIISPISRALSDLQQSLTEADEALESLQDRRSSSVQVRGDSLGNQLAGEFQQALRSIRTTSRSARRELDSFEKAIPNLQKQIQEVFDPETKDRLNLRLEDARQNADRLREGLASLGLVTFGRLAGQLNDQLRLDLVRTQAELAREAIENTTEAEVRAARLRRDAFAERRATVRGEIELLRERLSVVTQENQEAIRQLRAQRVELSRQTAPILQAIADAGGDLNAVSEADQRALREIERLDANLQRAIETEELRFKIRSTQLNLLLEDAKRQQEVLQFAQNNPVAAGLAESAIANSVINTFETVREIGESTISGLASFISQSLSDAFDPTTDSDISERFGRFVQGLGRQIVETFTRVAVSLLALNALSGGLLSFLGNGFGSVGGFINAGGLPAAFAKGGEVSKSIGRRAAASLTHYIKPYGLARGGPTPHRSSAPAMRPPKGLDPRDKIPIWAAAGEWVIRAPSAMKAGAEVMDRFNKGQFDLAKLREAVGLSALSRANRTIRAAAGPGFAEGGMVSPRAADTARSAPTVVPAAGPSVAVVAPSNESVERLLSGGSDGFLRFLRGNRDEVRGILGV